jgi:hypothetical protein
MAVKKAAKKVSKDKVETRNTAEKHSLADIAETLRSLKTKFGDEAIMTLSESKNLNRLDWS